MESELLRKHIERLQELKGATVEAGWFESATYPNDGEQHHGEKVATVARLQNQGFTTSLNFGHGPVVVHVPARPFMWYAMKLFANQRRTMERNIAKKLFSGKIDADQALGQVGLALEGCIVKSIKNGPWEPNAAYTIRKKGFDKPLIDSANMWQTVVSKVTK